MSIEPDKPVAETTDSAPPAPPRKRKRSRLLPLLMALALGVPSGFLFARMIRIPAVDKLDNYRPNIITRLYSRDEKVFAEYAVQRRIIIPKSEIAPALLNAIVSTEDQNFYKHGGIDPKAILRAGIKDIIARKKVEGASTITQQLAKMLFLTPEKSWRRKINEMFLSIEIEKNFTKDQIIEMYANQVYFGHGAYGVEAAARLYFGKHAKELAVEEAAVIAGMIRLPLYYSPFQNPQNTISRRNHVLRRLLERGYINNAEYAVAREKPLTLGTFKGETPNVGAYFSEEVRKHLENRYGAEDLYSGGLAVHTTLDIAMQGIAEKALRRGLHRIDHRRGLRKPARNLVTDGVDPETYSDDSWDAALVDETLYPAVVLAVSQKELEVRFGKEKVVLGPASWRWTRKPTLKGFLKRGDLIHVRSLKDSKSGKSVWYVDQQPQVQGALVVIDVKTGEVRSMVGGYDFKASKFNRAVQALRQTGSAFKPFVYGAAFEKGYTPADTLFDAPVAIRVGNQNYAPRNYYGKYAGIVTIQRAMELSINVPAVKTYMMVGGDRVVDFSRRCGITSDLPKYPSLALGSAGVSPLELTAAFNVFANQGVHVKPRLIRRITDSTKKVIEENTPELSEATSAQTAFVMTRVMEGTIDRGTAYAAHDLPGDYAGKTGTTNGYTDAWFVGYGPDLSVGVWIGYDDPSRSLGGGSTGGDIALPIWEELFRDLETAKLREGAKLKFEVPPGVVLLKMDLQSGRRGVGPCGRVIEEAFVSGTEPNKDCSGASVAVTKLPFYLQRQFYEPKEAEPVQVAPDATAQPGEGGEAAPPEPPNAADPAATSTAGRN